MIFELVDMETGNVLGAYESEESALLFFHDLAKRNSHDVLASIALIREDESGHGSVVAEGAVLLHRAESMAA